MVRVSPNNIIHKNTNLRAVTSRSHSSPLLIVIRSLLGFGRTGGSLFGGPPLRFASLFFIVSILHFSTMPLRAIFNVLAFFAICYSASPLQTHLMNSCDFSCSCSACVYLNFYCYVCVRHYHSDDGLRLYCCSCCYLLLFSSRFFQLLLDFL